MSKATDIWFPVYIGDYTSATMHLTTEQHGAYFLLLMAAWKSDGFLPDDDDQLAAICRLSAERWEKTRRVIAGFWIIEDGRWSQKRLTAELEKAKARKKVASANGALGGRPKKPARLPAGNPLGYPEHNPQKSSSPSPSTVSENIYPQKPASNPLGYSQAKYTGASPEVRAVFDAYPSTRKIKDRVSSVGKTLADYDTIAFTMNTNPDYPLLEIVKMYAKSTDAPQDLRTFLKALPDENSLRKSSAAQPAGPNSHIKRIEL